jgi:hypothetical protein
MAAASSASEGGRAAAVVERSPDDQNQRAHQRLQAVRQGSSGDRAPFSRLQTALLVWTASTLSSRVEASSARGRAIRRRESSSRAASKSGALPENARARPGRRHRSSGEMPMRLLPERSR